MKQNIHNHGMMITMLLSFLTSSAYDFEVDGIYYNVLSLDDLTCEVTFNETNKSTTYLSFYTLDGTNEYRTSLSYPSYSGRVEVPANVTYKGRTLSVTGIGEYAFLNCRDLTSLELPSSISSISMVSINTDHYYDICYAGAFDYCGIQTFSAGNAYTLMKFDQSYAASSGYKTEDNLKYLTLSEDFSGTINVNFSGYANLTNIMSNAINVPDFSILNPFSDKQYLNMKVFVPEEAFPSYQSDTVWNKFWDLIAMKPVKSIALNETNLSLEPMQKFQLSATVSPVDAFDLSVTWSSSNPLVATVDANGDVTAITKGDAIIMATANYGYGIKAECSVHVDLLIKDLQLSETEIGLEPGNTKQLQVEISPKDAFVQDVVWSSDNEDVATVDEQGNVTAHSVGVANITVATTDGSNLSANCKATVVNLVKSIKVTPDETFINEGDNLYISVLVAPEYATNKNVVWSSDNPDIASVDASGFVTAVTSGTTVIRATATDGTEIAAGCIVHVVLPVRNIQLSETEIGLEPGNTKQLQVEILPKDAFVQDVVWSSDNEDVATVDEQGNVTAHSVGVANITVATTDGSNLSANCKATVVNLVKSIEVTPGEATINEGENLPLSASVAPEYATYKDVVWSSDNVDVASVDASGLITAVSPGTTLIKATASDGSGVFGQCKVSVIAETFKYNGICYQRNSLSTLKIVANPENPYSGDFIIPANAMFKDSEMPVTEIGDNALADCSDLKRIVIPNSISKISETAFSGCTKLRYVKFCNGSSIEANLDALFPDSPIQEIYIGSNGLTYNSDSRLLTVIRSMTLGGSVTNLPPKEAFNNFKIFIVEEGENPIIETDDYCSSTIEQTGQQTVKDPDTHIYYRLFYLIRYYHLFPIIEALQNGTLNYLHIGREVDRVEDDTSKTEERIPTTAGSRYQEYGYMDEIHYQYDSGIVIDDYNRNPVESISINESAVELKIGDSIKLSAICLPQNASYKTVKWSSSDEDVAIVDLFGNVTKLTDGEAIITASTSDGTNLSATCKIVKTGSGIYKIAVSAEDVYVVYNLQGILIMETDNVESIKQLPAGIYIVNGKKILI